MSKYSILFEAESFHEIGPFRFPIYKDLTPGEAKGIEALTKKQARSTYRSMRLAQQISKDRKITIKEAIDLLSNIGEEENQDLLYRYSGEVEALSAETLTATEQKIEYVTLFMRYRGQVKFPSTPDWSPTTDWNEGDTEVLPTKLLNSIFEFVLWERDGWPAPEADPAPSGKAPEAPAAPKPQS